MHHWSTSDIAEWFSELGFKDLSQKVGRTSLNGQQLTVLKIDEIVKTVGVGTLFLNLSGGYILAYIKLQILFFNDVEDQEQRNALRLHLYWLRCEMKKNCSYSQQNDAPHQFLCPITHEIMTDPVICSGLFGKFGATQMKGIAGIIVTMQCFFISTDGFTYERGAITEWLLCGRYTSPMTNEILKDLKFLPNTTLKTNILKYLYGVDVKD